MLEPGREPDLALESLGAEGDGELGKEDLERDQTVVLQVPREVDGRHAAAAELALEDVAAFQAFGQGHGRRLCFRGIVEYKRGSPP